MKIGATAHTTYVQRHDQSGLAMVDVAPIRFARNGLPSNKKIIYKVCYPRPFLHPREFGLGSWRRQVYKPLKKDLGLR